MCFCNKIHKFQVPPLDHDMVDWQTLAVTKITNVSGQFSLYLYAYIFELFYVLQFDVDLDLYGKLVHNQVRQVIERDYLARDWN